MSNSTDSTGGAAGQRRDYSGSVSLQGDNPESLFSTLLAQADEVLGQDARAMTLATTAANGAPDARIVLLRRWENGCLGFFGGGLSAKGRALQHRPEAALVFFWSSLDLQVRIQGPVEQLPIEIIDAYFASRPGPNRFAAGLAVQSSVLEEGWDALHQRYLAGLAHADDSQRPADWLGWQVVPRRWEFWQGQASRLNQRLVFSRPSVAADWQSTWLAP